jgi:hypothetical protein
VDLAFVSALLLALVVANQAAVAVSLVGKWTSSSCANPEAWTDRIFLKPLPLLNALMHSMSETSDEAPWVEQKASQQQ